MVAAVTVRKNGKAEMAYVGEKPWHGLGQELTKNAPLKTWIKEAGMDWSVERSPVSFNNGKSMQVWEDQNVLFRSDTRKPLSVVSDGYKIVQPKEVMEFFRDLTEKNGMTMETAGTLFGGRRYWALAKTGHQVNVGGKDLVGGYLLLATSCDGSYATTAKFTSIRVVCNNTLTAAMSGRTKNAVQIRHSSQFSATDVKIDLGLLDETWITFGQNLNNLAKQKISKKQAVQVLVRAFGDAEQFEADVKKGDLDLAFAAQPNATGMAKIMALFDGAGIGADLPGSKGTAWGLVNATTQYFDHTAGRIQDARLSKAWFGKNENKKLAVLEEAMALVK